MSDNEKYTDIYNPDFVPGTINLMMDKLDDEQLRNMDGQSSLKTNKDGVILHPQPSDSPNDPLNWSWKTKLYQYSILLFITGFTAATSNDAGAVQDSMNELYNISYDSMNTGAGVLFAAIGLNAYFLGPTASLYGRKLTYMICIVMGLIGAIWFGYATKTTDTIWSQLFVGASESCAEALVQQSISDMYFQHQLSASLTGYILATSVGTYMGPLIAGFIVEYAGFRWVGWIAAIISGGLIIILFTTQYETTFDRSKYFGKLDSSSVPRESTTGTTDDEKVKKMDGADVVENHELASFNSPECHSNPSMYGTGENEKRIPYYRRVQMVTKSPSLKGFGIRQYAKQLVLMLRIFWFPPVILSGLLWGLQDTFLTFYLTTEDDMYYDEPWNYSDVGVALMNVPCLIGAIIGCFYAGWFSDKVVFYMAKRRNGIHEAEDYLWMLIVIAIVDPIGLMIFAAGTDQVWSWKVTYTVGLGFIGFSFGCAGDIAMSYLMSAYPEMVLEGMIGVALINNGISCLFTFFCSPWLNVMGNTRTYAVLSAIWFLLCLMVFPFVIYGKRIRRWTKKYYIGYIEQRDGLTNANA